MKFQFPDKVKADKKSLIREVAEKGSKIPGFISFALGSPAAECVPTKLLQEAASDVFENYPSNVFNYGPLAGYEPLRTWIKDRLVNTKGFQDEGNNVLMVSGSGKGVATVTRALSGEGDEIYCDELSYPNAINGIQYIGAKTVGIPWDEFGMIPEELEKAAQSGKGKWIYLIPNFHNPRGITMPLERRKEIYEIAKKYGLVIYEDDPYGDVRFTGEDIPTFKSMDTENLVIYAGSFSKTLSAGLRVGYLYGSDELLKKVGAVKNADGQDPLYNQMIVSFALNKMDFDEHLDSIRKVYKKKCDLMIETLQKECSANCDVKVPQGGLFIWVDVPESVNLDEMSDAAIEAGVGAVKSSAFMVTPDFTGHGFRLNFSALKEEDIVKGAAIFGKITKQFCE